MKYRPEIDGLRALAVVAVVVFHIDAGLLEGGFLGVDVFFVISGFLITTIIQNSIDRDSFSLKSFWMRRIKRLYPALLVTLCCVVIAGNFILIDPERSDLFVQSLAATFSFSNIHLYLTTGNYWSNSSENIALLHTWSLSLEEQFYIVFPLFLLFYNRVIKRGLAPVLVVIACISFVISIYLTPIDQSAAFYLLPARVWELLLGGIIALWGPDYFSRLVGRKLSSLLSLSGVALIVASFFVIAYNDYFPGYRAIIPCLGTAFVLAFGKNDAVGTSVLGFAPINYIGRISYSLYLWHWPLIVFSRFMSPEPDTGFIIVLTFVFSVLSYHFVENPFRKGSIRHQYVIGLAPVLVIALAFPLCLGSRSPGLHESLIELEDRYTIPIQFERDATASILETGKGVSSVTVENWADVLLLGDSHAQALASAVAQHAIEQKLVFENMSAPGVQITDDKPKPRRSYAGDLNAARLNRLDSLKTKVGIFAGAWVWDVDRDNFDETFREYLSSLSESCELVYVIGQVPMVELPPTHEKALNKYVLAQFRATETLEFSSDPRIKRANKAVKAIIDEVGFRNVEFLDAYSLLKIDGEGVRVIEGGSFYYSDYYHINDRGAELLINELLAEKIRSGLGIE